VDGGLYLARRGKRRRGGLNGFPASCFHRGIELLPELWIRGWRVRIQQVTAPCMVFPPPYANEAVLQPIMSPQTQSVNFPERFPRFIIQEFRPRLWANDRSVGRRSRSAPVLPMDRKFSHNIKIRNASRIKLPGISGKRATTGGRFSVDRDGGHDENLDSGIG
jgi:hypothetical protein